MIVPDVNLLVYAHNPDALLHDAARRWWEDLLSPGADHLRLFRQNLNVPGSGHRLVPNAHIAALVMERDAELHSSDSDFARFPGLRWHNPLR